MWNVWTRLAERKGEGGGAGGPWSQCVPPQWLAGEESAWGRVCRLQDAARLFQPLLGRVLRG